MAEQSPFGSVCAVVVTFNIGNAFDTCFNSLKGQVDHIVIVNTSIDGGVTRHAVERIREENPDMVTLIEGTENNLALARNLGIDAALEAGHDWVLLMDHDSRLGAGMIAALEQAYFKSPVRQDIGILAPLPLHYQLPESGTQSSTQGDHPAEGRNDLYSVPASGSLIPRRALADNRMDESLVIDYADTDFCLRLRKKGFRILTVPNARMTHGLGRYKRHSFFGQSVTVTHRPAHRRYYQFRNRVLLWRRYCGLFPSFFLEDFGCALREFFLILFFEQDRINKMKHILHGMADGLLNRSGAQPGTTLLRESIAEA